MADLWRIVTTLTLVAHLMVGCCCADHARLCGEFANASSQTSWSSAGSCDECADSPVGHPIGSSLSPPARRVESQVDARNAALYPGRCPPRPATTNSTC